MKRVAFIVFVAAGVAVPAALPARADPAGVSRITQGSQPPWLKVRASPEDGAVSFVVRIDSSKLAGLADISAPQITMSLVVREGNRTVLRVPVRLSNTDVDTVTTMTLPSELAQKAVLELEVRSAFALDGQLYEARIGTWLAERAPADAPDER